MQGGPGVRGVWGVQGVSGGFRGGQEVWAENYHAAMPGFCAQMAQGTPFRCLPWPTPPNFKVLGGERGRSDMYIHEGQYENLNNLCAIWPL